MSRATIAVLSALMLFFGCAANSGKEISDLNSRMDEMSRLQSRQNLRIEELTKNVLSMHEKINAQATEMEELRLSLKENIEEPPLPVVKLSPPEPAPKPAPDAVKPRPAPKPKPASSPKEESFQSHPEMAKKTAPPAASDLYRRAYSEYEESRFGSAILDFEEFLRLYPKHEYSDNAQYWIGESYYSQGEYGQAIVEFNKVLDKYAHEDKASAALLKIGLSLSNMGDGERSKVFLKRLVSEYPQSDAALEAQKLLAGNP